MFDILNVLLSSIIVYSNKKDYVHISHLYTYFHTICQILKNMLETSFQLVTWGF